MKTLRLNYNHASFPEQLRQIPSPPRQVYWAGADLTQLLVKPAIAVVGSRKASAYGKFTTIKFTEELVTYGLLIVSGLALGIDSIAHEACLRSGGKTIAVLPSGLDKVYPASHSELARRIARKGGGLLSEYPENTHPQNQNFIARNRLIAGLAQGLLITEAALNSGSLHTARFALEQGKTVMAVPGNISSYLSEGTNNLIKAGAIPVTSTQDILEALNIPVSSRKPAVDNAKTPEEFVILQIISSGVTEGEAILNASQLSPALFNQTLTSLEISGRIRPLGANHWSLR